MSDRSEFDDFVHARAGALGRTAYLLTGDHHQAEDLLQTAALQLARHWERVHTSPEAFVRRTMYHQNISWWRKRRLREAPLEGCDVSAPSSDHTLRLSLDAALARLTAKQRTVLVLRYFEDLTELQTAEALGIGLGTVKSTTRQALGRLRVLAPDLAELMGTTS